MPDPDDREWEDAAVPDRGPERDQRTGRAAAAQRMSRKTQWVDMQVQQAIERGEFDDLPGSGKPIADLGSNDPDWWLKRLIEREKITGVLPPALALRKEDAELDARLDHETAEKPVREILDDFNRRIIEARRQLQGGPPVITRTRDVDAEVEAWRSRRAARLEARRDRGRVARADPAIERPVAERPVAERPVAERRRWLRRRTDSHDG